MYLCLLWPSSSSIVFDFLALNEKWSQAKEFSVDYMSFIFFLLQISEKK